MGDLPAEDLEDRHRPCQGALLAACHDAHGSLLRTHGAAGYRRIDISTATFFYPYRKVFGRKHLRCAHVNNQRVRSRRLKDPAFPGDDLLQSRGVGQHGDHRAGSPRRFSWRRRHLHALGGELLHRRLRAVMDDHVSASAL